MQEQDGKITVFKDMVYMCRETAGVVQYSGTMRTTIILYNFEKCKSSILLSDEACLRVRRIARDNNGYCIMIKGLIH